MSAYLCNPDVIALIADYARRHISGIDDAHKAAAVLLKENVASVSYRYKQTPARVYRDFTGMTERQYKVELAARIQGYGDRLPDTINPFSTIDDHEVIFAACRQLDYQSCERPTYYKSLACSLIAQCAFAAARQLINP